MAYAIIAYLKITILIFSKIVCIVQISRMCQIAFFFSGEYNFGEEIILKKTILTLHVQLQINLLKGGLSTTMNKLNED